MRSGGVHPIVGRPRLTVGVLGCLIALLLGTTGVLRPLELASMDIRFLLRGAQPGDDNRVLVVAIDQHTDQHIGRAGQFPIPRRYYAQALDRLAAEGARAVGIDVEFTTPSDTADDNALILGLERHPGTVLAAAATRSGGQTQVLGGADGQALARVTVASALFPLDAGATYRSFDFRESGLPTLAMALAKKSDPELTPQQLGPAPVWINFPGGPGTVHTVSLLRLIEGRVPAASVRGKTVLIGVTDLGAFDQHSYSVLSSQRMSGVEVEADAVATALARAPLRTAPGWLDVLVALLATVAVPLVLIGRRTLMASWLLLLALVAYLGLAQLLFDAGVVVPVAAPMLGMAVTGLVGLGLSYTVELIARTIQVQEARRRAVDAGDAARHQVERDLHDGVQQRLVALAMRMSTPSAAADPDLLAGSVDEIKVALGELRQLARGTYPAALREGGLTGALTSLADHAVVPTRLQVGPLGGLSDRTVRTAYFVAAEGVANAHKHAQATRLELSAEERNGALCLTLIDDGRGGADPEGSGLRGLRERAEAAGGTLTIHSPLGAGTELLLRLPLQDG